MGIAHELITRGWTKCVLENRSGEVCLVGAVAHAYGIRGVYDLCSSDVWPELPENVTAALLAVVPDVLGPEGQDRNVIAFNDADHRTFDEVLRVAKEADELLGL